MKKIKLLMPILGLTAASGMILPAVSCGGGQQEDVTTYKVSISKDFKISRDHAVENEEFTAEVSWDDATKAVNETTMKITVGNQQLGSTDYKYTATGDKTGSLKIFKNIINGNVSITLELLDITKAPIEVINVSSSTMGVVVSGPKSTDVDTDAEFDITWPAPSVSNPTYFTNLISIFIGGKQIPSASKEEGGYVIKHYTSSSATIFIPSTRIRNNSTITIVVDLEKAGYDIAMDMSTFDENILTITQGYLPPTVVAKYEGLRDSNDVNVQTPADFPDVTSGETLEFEIDLSKWEDNLDWKTGGGNPGENNDDIFLILGYWDVDYLGDWTGDYIGIDADLSQAGRLYYNETPLEVTQYSDPSSTIDYIRIHAPEGGWVIDGNKLSITGWYTFTNPYDNVQILAGMPIPLS